MDSQFPIEVRFHDPKKLNGGVANNSNKIGIPTNNAPVTTDDKVKF